MGAAEADPPLPRVLPHFNHWKVETITRHGKKVVKNANPTEVVHTLAITKNVPKNSKIIWKTKICCRHLKRISAVAENPPRYILVCHLFYNNKK